MQMTQGRSQNGSERKPSEGCATRFITTSASGIDNKESTNVDCVVSELSGIQSREGNSLGYGKTVSKNLGASYALVTMAENHGLRDMLSRHFGDMSDSILSIAVTDTIFQSRNPMAERNPDHEMASELLGVQRVPGGGSPEDMYVRLGRRMEDVCSMLDEMLASAAGVLVYGESEFSVREGCTATLLTGYDGIPVYYGIAHDDDDPKEGLDERLSGTASEALFVIRKPISTEEDLGFIPSRGFSLVSAVEHDSPIMKGVDERRVETSVHHRNGADYVVSSAPMDSLAGNWKDTPIMWSSIPVREQSLDRARIERRIYSIYHRLESLSPEDAMSQFSDTAGSLSRFFDISLVDGVLELNIRRGDLDDYLEPKPRTVLTCGIDTWEHAMDILDTAADFDELRSEFADSLLTCSCGSTEDECQGRAFIVFLSLVMRSMMRKALRNSESSIDVDTALDWLDSLKSIGDRNRWKAIGMTPRIQKVLTSLGVSPPRGDIITPSSQ